MAKSIKNHVDFAVGYKPQEITFVYVLDLVNAIFAAIDKKVSGRTYFVTDGYVYTSRSFSDLLQRELRVSHVLHIKAPLWVLRCVSAVSERFSRLFGKTSTLNGDKYKIMKQRNWQCDISPLRDELGFTPQWDLERGVRASVEWYKKEKWL
jgi:UDP-glucose 4-epimerase